MTNYRNNTVIRLIGINSPLAIERDEDFQIGTITMDVGPKVRIMWDGTNTPTYAFKSELTKYENGTFLFRPMIETDSQVVYPKPDETDIVPITDILPIAREAYIADKAVQEELSVEMQAEPDLNDNTDNEDKAVKPAAKPRTRRTTK